LNWGSQQGGFSNRTRLSGPFKGNKPFGVTLSTGGILTIRGFPTTWVGEEYFPGIGAHRDIGGKKEMLSHTEAFGGIIKESPRYVLEENHKQVFLIERPKRGSFLRERFI